MDDGRDNLTKLNPEVATDRRSNRYNILLLSRVRCRASLQQSSEPKSQSGGWQGGGELHHSSSWHSADMSPISMENPNAKTASMVTRRVSFSFHGTSFRLGIEFRTRCTYRPEFCIRRCLWLITSLAYAVYSIFVLKSIATFFLNRSCSVGLWTE